MMSADEVDQRDTERHRAARAAPAGPSAELISATTKQTGQRSRTGFVRVPMPSTVTETVCPATI